MALDPPSDIVLEVARAADPARAAAVLQRLNALSVGPGALARGADFKSALDEAKKAAETATPRVEGAPDLRARLFDAGLSTGEKAAKVQVQFEAAMLNNFIAEMLPKESPEFYGKGVSGQMWRSLLAEKIANQIAGSGALGLGQRLFATHPISAAGSLAHAGRIDQSMQAPSAQASANPISVANGARVANGAFLFARDKSL